MPLISQSCPNPESSKKLAQEFYEAHLKPSSNYTIFLEGGLGAGKSFFTQELLTHHGISGEIPSPTYTLMNQYQTTTGQQFAHFDFYRLTDPQDFFVRGFAETAEDPNVSCFVEWPDKIPDVARKAFSGAIFWIQIKHGLGVGMRNVKIRKI